MPAAFYPVEFWALAPAVLICAAYCFFHAVRSFFIPNDREFFSDPRLSLLLFALAATAVWSIGRRFTLGISIPEALLGASYTLLFWAGFRLRNEAFFWRSFALLVATAALYHTVLGVFQWQDSPQTNLAHRAWDVLGAFDVHTELAGLLALALPLTAGLLIIRRNPLIKGALALLLLALLGGLVIVAARGVWAALIIVCAIALILLPGRQKYAWALAVLLTAGVAAYLGRDMVLSRLALWTDWRSIGSDPRFECWSMAIRLLLENPLTGVGLGYFPAESVSIKPPDLDRWPVYAFNYFLHMGAETGFLGLLVFLMFFLLCAVSAFAVLKLKGPDEPAGPLKKASAFAVIGFLLHSLIDHNFQTPFNASVFMLLAASIMQRPKENARPSVILRTSAAGLTAGILAAISLLVLIVLPLYAAADRHYQLGHDKMRSGKSVEAKNHFNRSLERFPYHYPAAFAMAKLWTRVADNDRDLTRKKLLWQGAYQRWSHVVRLNPTMPEHHINLVKARIGMNGDVVLQSDLDDLSRYIDKRPGQPRSRYMAGAFVLARCGPNDLACADWSAKRLHEASDLDPKFKWRSDQALKKYRDLSKRSSL